MRKARWVTKLLQYNFEVKYKKGGENAVADALLRLPLPNDKTG